MAEHGVAGLSLGEVARRLGIRPPSLYVYFASKNALYDELFARGSREILEVLTEAIDDVLEHAETLAHALLTAARAMVRWSVDNPVYAQLLFWRPVPGFEPSAESYQPAVALMEVSSSSFRELQGRGWLRDDITVEQLLRDWTIVIAGVVSQQLSNAPDEGFETGRFTAALPSVVSMFVHQYAAPKPVSRKSSSAPTRRGRREHQG
jgi:AcrR family transcriptional regulator